MKQKLPAVKQGSPDNSEEPLTGWALNSSNPPSTEVPDFSSDSDCSSAGVVPPSGAPEGSSSAVGSTSGEEEADEDLLGFLLDGGILFHDE
jgi:hypothetical protein